MHHQCYHFKMFLSDVWVVCWYHMISCDISDLRLHKIRQTWSTRKIPTSSKEWLGFIPDPRFPWQDRHAEFLTDENQQKLLMLTVVIGTKPAEMEVFADLNTQEFDENKIAILDNGIQWACPENLGFCEKSNSSKHVKTLGVPWIYGVCHTMGFAFHPQERGFGAPVNPAQAQPGQPGAGPAWRKLTVIAESPWSLIKKATKIRRVF